MHSPDEEGINLSLLISLAVDGLAAALGGEFGAICGSYYAASFGAVALASLAHWSLHQWWLSSTEDGSDV